MSLEIQPGNDTRPEHVAYNLQSTPVRQCQTPHGPGRNDLFHARVPRALVHQVFDVMAATPQHTYQILTKRSRRLRLLAPGLRWPPNVWMGVSIEHDGTAYRADDLRTVPAAVRFLSLEPLLGPLPGLGLEGIDWVIAGGESGPGFRPVELDWIRGVRDRCTEHRVAFFFKQVGGITPKAGGRELDGRTWDQMPPAPRPGSSPVSRLS